MLKHIEDRSAYCRLSPQDARMEAHVTSIKINDWCNKWMDAFPPSWIEFIIESVKKAAEEPFGYFYLMYKILRTLTSMRPVCSIAQV